MQRGKSQWGACRPKGPRSAEIAATERTQRLREPCRAQSSVRQLIGLARASLVLIWDPLDSPSIARLATCRAGKSASRCCCLCCWRAPMVPARRATTAGAKHSPAEALGALPAAAMCWRANIRACLRCDANAVDATRPSLPCKPRPRMRFCMELCCAPSLNRLHIRSRTHSYPSAHPLARPVRLDPSLAQQSSFAWASRSAARGKRPCRRSGG